MTNFKVLLNSVNTFIFDVDGVLTDGSLILLPEGDQLRTMNIKDGYALQLAVKNGYKVIVISGGTSEPVRMRLNKLGINEIFMGIKDKVEVLDKMISKYDLRTEQILYMGDDVPDYKVMQKVGVATCPLDAVTDIKNISIYTSPKKGGEGCVRDVIEQVMRLHGTWDQDTTVKAI